MIPHQSLTPTDRAGTPDRVHQPELRHQPPSLAEHVLFEVKRLIVGQDHLLERLLVALLSRGHVLLEGVPGLAKTATIKALAQVVGGSFGRVQFTPDLVPSDLVGTRIFNGRAGEFTTELGPVFVNLLLADEINRAPAKVQSALLEVMQERQVTIGKQTFAVPDPFMVLATQNPIESDGTYPLPEAQLDRFMFKVLVDYPGYEDELVVVERMIGAPIELRTRLTPERLIALQEAAGQVYVDPRVDRLRRDARHGYAGAGRARARRAGAGRPVRRQSAGVDQSGPRRAGARLAARARVRPAEGRGRPVPGCAAPSPRPQLRGHRQRRDAGRDRQGGAGPLPSAAN